MRTRSHAVITRLKYLSSPLLPFFNSPKTANRLWVDVEQTWRLSKSTRHEGRGNVATLCHLSASRRLKGAEAHARVNDTTVTRVYVLLTCVL